MSLVTVIKKRNGEVLPFEIVKIESAVRGAFREVTREENGPVANQVALLVAQELELMMLTREGYIPSVEHIQDLVEKTLMKTGFFDVAKSYIVFRYAHAKAREEKRAEDLELIEENGLSISFADGHSERFNEKKMRKTLELAALGFEKDISIDQIVNQLKLEMYDGMPVKELRKAMIMVVRAMIEQDPAYSYMASKLVLTQINEDLFGKKSSHEDVKQAYENAFVSGIKKGVERNILDVRMLDFDLDMLAKTIDSSRDSYFMFLGTQTLYERYLVRDSEGDGKIMEHIQGFWMRVAMGIAIGEMKKDMNRAAVEFYDVMSTLRFVPSSPTLFHSGTKHPQLSSCYLNYVEDSLEHIFKVYGDNSQLSKWAGGIGTSWTSVRASGALVKKSGIKSNGIVPFLKIANDVTVAINRSGRRRGATCVYLENWHYDVEEFLELRKNTGDDRRRTHDIDTALWISDLFMKRCEQDGDWTLLSPDECADLPELYGKKFEIAYVGYEKLAAEGKLRVSKVMKARDLWRKMITMLFETGHPWITFKDPSNIRSPQDHAGVVHCSNLCTEITLNNSVSETAVCNLGSLNYQRLVRNNRLDLDLVAQTVKTAMRMLDNVIDVNFYPTVEAKNSNMAHRPVGLGLMGFQDALYMMNIPFDSEEAVKFADESMEFVSYHAIMTSSMLAKERGAYSSYKGSKWDRNIFPVDTLALLEEERGIKIPIDRVARLDWSPVRAHVKEFGMRNSNCMALAPTATISNIVGSTPTIEPIYKNMYVKANMNGDFIIINPYLVSELKAIGMWDFEMIGKLKYNDGSIASIVSIPEKIRAKYKEVFEIDSKWLIRSAATRAKWIDQSQSLNIYFSGSSGRDLAALYEYAWSLGLKTTYYLRSLGASQVEKSTVNAADFGKTHVRESVVAAVSMEAAVAMSASAEMSSVVSSVGVSNSPAVVKRDDLNGASVKASSSVVSPMQNMTKGERVEGRKVYNITALPEATCDGCQ